MKIVLIGAGNVATHFSKALSEAGSEICQIYSRSVENASALSAKLGCSCTVNIEEVRENADIYLFAVSDDALAPLVRQLKTGGGIWIHTAGSIPGSVFAGYAENYGVMYPLQTFSRNRELDFSKVPLFIEGNTRETEAAILSLAETVSDNVRVMDSEKRKRLHPAAVFACNFTNHMYRIAVEILEEQQTDRHLLLPLIDETAAKLHTLTPAEAQTGPAVRNDADTMNSHIALLKNDGLREIYRIISRNIQTFVHENQTNMINYDLKKIKAFIFDVDGVLSANKIPLALNGDPMRTANIKDGFAIHLAVKKGFETGIITGGYTEAVKIRYERLGVRHIYMKSSVKRNDYEHFLAVTGLKDEEVMYCGDDLPDYEVMKRAGLSAAPADAAPEIRQIARYVSPFSAGDGVARDIIEQTLKAQNLWMDGDAFGW
jgi:YrbI family 3-deoxy-D-manno-octulosonate 8-phosphate phosphatase